MFVRNMRGKIKLMQSFCLTRYFLYEASIYCEEESANLENSASQGLLMLNLNDGAHTVLENKVKLRL
jgi:hypothetical protein